MVIMVATMLHSIATGNMLPANVKVIVIDINQPTVTKLMDRGTWQALGIVSDAGAFLPMVSNELQFLMIDLLDKLSFNSIYYTIIYLNEKNQKEEAGRTGKEGTSG